MPLTILIVVVFVTVVLVVFAFGAALATPSSVLGARLRALGGQPVQAPEKAALKVRERLEQALDPISKAIPLSPADVTRTRAWLIQAGLRESRHASYYFGSRLLLAALGLGAVIALSGFESLSLLVCVPALGFFIPRFFLKRMINDRQQRIRVALPDALDLTVICVDRTGVDDIRSLVGTLIQTDRFGTSIAQALRVHSDSLRTARRQRAEEQAAKTTIKMVPPLVLFILVPFLFVTVGPALIQAYHSLVGK